MTANKLAAALENLILNGDFAQDSTHWALAGPARISDGYFFADFGGLALQTVSIQKGGEYQISFISRTPFSADGPGRGALTLTSQPSGTKVERIFDHTQSGDWRALQYTFTLPPSDTDVTVQLLGATYGALFDDVVLRRVELIKNGDFGELETHWDVTATEPDDFKFQPGYCVGTRNAYAEQTVAVDPGTPYHFSLKTRITSNGTGTALLEMDSGHFQVISFHDDHPWTTRGLDFTAPAGSTALRVILLGGDGQVSFDDISLKVAPDGNA